MLRKEQNTARKEMEKTEGREGRGWGRGRSFCTD